MSTPMRHGPSQQGRTPSQYVGTGATPQASTPFSNSQTQAAFSPRGPRSSPQQFKKSPAAKNSAATPMGHPSNPPVNFDSPSAAAALGALGMNDLNLDSMSMSGLAGGSGRGSEEEFRKRLDEIIELLWSAKSALVSNDALERLANHLGLECMWEDAIGGGEGAKTLIIAGTGFSVEIGVNKHIVQDAALAFGEEVVIVDKHLEKASAILKDDLVLGPDQSPLTKRMRDFWSNLERLRDMDKLSVNPGFNCHEAIAGLFESLDSLHKWDVAKLHEIQQLSSKSDEQLKAWALATRNGAPQMHVRHRVGLTLDYWMEKFKRPDTKIGREDAKVWGIFLGCAHPNPNNMGYSPARVSDKWIGPSIEKHNLTDEEAMMSGGNVILDWLEPAATLLPSSQVTKNESGMDTTGDMLSGPKPPEVIFTATFEPPLIVPNHAAMEVYNLAGTQAQMSTTTFDALLFPIPRGALYDPSEPRVVEHAMKVPTWEKRLQNHTQDEPEIKTHSNTLHIYKPVYGQVLRSVPFSHPRELVQMLPTLRQYAFLSTLLYRSFTPKEGSEVSAKAAGLGPPPKPQSRATSANGSTTQTAAIDDFHQFMSGGANGASGGSIASTPSGLAVDITLTAHPVPRLQVVFPFKSETANIQLEIQPGGKVVIISDNVFPKPDGNVNTGRGPLGSLSAAQWAKKLEFTEDIGAWIELVKMSLE